MGFGESNLTPASDESEAARDIAVGSKGARIVVRKLEEKRGRVASIDVELADGQVLKHIDAGTIRKSFVAAND
jgi:hypothetical protein